MTDATAGERLVQAFGIQTPQDLDVVAIAKTLGATVRYEPMTGCEARIVGTDRRAIICVNENSHPTRQRFSIAHEIAHWHFDRQRGVLVCLASDMEKGEGSSRDLIEESADRVASHILMPRYLVEPVLGRLSTLTFDAVRKIEHAFGTSTPASAIRLVELSLVPGLLVCHKDAYRQWFTRARDVPAHWFPRKKCIPGPPTGRSRIAASNWFDCPEAEDAELVQESLQRSQSGETLTLLTGFNSRMLADRESPKDRFESRGW